MKNRSLSSLPTLALAGVLILAISAAPLLAGTKDTPILSNLTTITQVASTIPANGDVNPYGIVVVPRSVGSLQAGNILVSNFNDSTNLQGTGTTIVQITPGGTLSTFAQIDASTLPGSCPGGVGLTTALVVLRSGWVIVGSLPTNAGTLEPGASGCLLVLDSNGNVAETITGAAINGPWDMTSFEVGNYVVLFVTNVLNGTLAANGNVVNEGTVVRVNLLLPLNGSAPHVEGMTVIASGFAEETNSSALVIGPTGLGLSAPCNPFDVKACSPGAQFPFSVALYVADTVNNRVAVIPDPFVRTTSAGTGITLSSGGTLNGPLGLAVAPNGHIITVNGGDGNATEITATGTQVASELLDDTGGPPPGNGALFGVVFDGIGNIYFVDDNSNTLNLLN